MTKYFCDRCGFEMAPPDQVMVSLSRQHIVYAAAENGKAICESCFKLWTEMVTRFFQRQGQ
jgi:hypothetical protein